MKRRKIEKGEIVQSSQRDPQDPGSNPGISENSGNVMTPNQPKRETHPDPPTNRAGMYGSSSGLANQAGGIQPMETETNPAGVTQRVDLDGYDMAKKRRIEEKKEGEKRKSEEPNHEKMKIVRSEGESQGQVNKEMDVDLIMDSEWERIKDELRQEKIPLLMIEGSDMDKAIQAARIQDMLGE